MPSDSGQKFIGRNRPPRVHITYQDPYNAEQKVELPFVMGVMADLSGNTPGVEKPEIGDRKFLDIDMDNFDKRMGEAIQPGVSFHVPNKLAEEAERKAFGAAELQEDGGFQPGRRRAPGSGAGQAARGARAARQSSALHGRQGAGRKGAQASC